MASSKLLQEELSFIVRGILYEVHNELGPHRNEKQYCDSIAYKLNEKRIKFIREFILEVNFPGEKAGRNRVDFLIDDKIILEIKAAPAFARDDYKQCIRYLVSSGKDLCFLVNFGGRACVIKRVLNPNLIKK